MDKYEYRAKTEQMLAYAEQKSYQKAMSIADTIDWRKVKNTAMLSTVSEIYENAGELGKARDTLFIAYDKAPSSRKIVYRLGIISLKLGHFDEATDCYEEFVKLSPKDPNQYILRYKILKAQKAPVKEQIEALEDFKHSEYVEKWAYELARLYAEAGMTSECLDECDDLILWFSEGTYVYQAMELKMKYKPLTPLQQEKYDHRNDASRKDSARRKPSFRKSKERPTPDPRIADKIRKDVHVTDSIDLPDLPEPMARTHASEPEAEAKPKTQIRSTSDISTTISGASLSDALKAGVAVASGAVPPEAATDDSQLTGKMKIEEILANWEATQRENAKILEKSQEEAEKEKALREKKKEEEEALGATKTILSDDIRKLMEQLENGEEPEITDEDAEEFVDNKEMESLENTSEVTPDDAEEVDLESDDFEEIVDSDEDDESDAVYDEEAEYEDEDDSEYDDDDEYDDEDDSEYNDDNEYDDEDDSEYGDDDEYDDEDDSEYDDNEYEDDDDSEYDDDEYENEDDSDFDDEEDSEDEDDFQLDDELDADHEEDFDFEDDPDFDIEDEDSDSKEDDFADLDSFEDEEELDDSDDYLDLEFDEEPAPAPEQKKEPSKSEPTPDIDEVLEIEEPSEDEITERMGKFDTGFVVQGRYDLSATSEIGLKLGLTEEQKQLFSYFVPIRGVSEQLVEILDNDKRCRNRYGTSRTGNILILGRKGSGKTVLAVDIVKAIQKQRRLKQGKVAIVTGDSMNKKDIGSIIDKLNGGALIIEKASKMNDRTIRELNDMMDEQTGELLFLLEDQKKPMERMFASHREFKRKFTSRLELPVFINDELVTFGQTYAKENG